MYGIQITVIDAVSVSIFTWDFQPIASSLLTRFPAMTVFPFIRASQFAHVIVHCAKVYEEHEFYIPLCDNCELNPELTQFVTSCSFSFSHAKGVWQFKGRICTHTYTVWHSDITNFLVHWWYHVSVPTPECKASFPVIAKTYSQLAASTCI